MAIASPVEQIKERVSLIDLIGQRVRLLKSGRNFKGLCPFHNEKTPSFYVFPDRDGYHCFGCSQHGDVFTWVMQTEHVDFGEALRQLAERAGVQLTSRQARGVEDERRSRLHEVNAAAVRYFQSMLFTPQGAPALRYLDQRGLTRATIEAFQLGWAPDAWDSLLTRLGQDGYTQDELATAGLAVERETDGHYDRFRGRITFPIHDPRGETIGFGGRGLGDAQPKYLNSSDSPIFTKGSALYAFDVARAAIRKEGVAIVVEGYMDALAAHQAGIANVVAALGTALTEEHLNMLKRLAPRVVLALDADAAGDAAALRTLEVVRATYGKIALPVADRRGLVRLRYDQVLDVRVARLPVGKDPDDVIRESPELFAQLVTEARPILEVLIDAEVARAGADPIARGQAADAVLDVVKDLPNPVVADQFTRLLAERAAVDYEALRLRLHDLRRAARRRAGPAPAVREAATPEPEALRDWLTFEEFVKTRIASNTEAARPVLHDLSPDDFYRADARAIFDAWQPLLAGSEPPGGDDLVAVLDGPLADHAAWIVAWGANLPAADTDELVVLVTHLRMLNYRREIAMIELRQRDGERPADAVEREGARLLELITQVRHLERLPGGRLTRPWREVFRAEARLGPLRTVARERRPAALDQPPPPLEEAAS